VVVAVGNEGERVGNVGEYVGYFDVGPVQIATRW